MSHVRVIPLIWELSATHHLDASINSPGSQEPTWRPPINAALAYPLAIEVASRVVSKLLWLGSYLGLGFLVVVLLARWLAWDDLHLFALLNDFTWFIYLPAWVVCVVALVKRRWSLAGLAVLVVVGQIVLVTPELAAATALPKIVGPHTTLRLFDANTYDGNPSMAGYLSEIASDRPDLVTLEEPTPQAVRQLLASPALASLPYHFAVYRYDSRGFLIASRYPIGSSQVHALQGVLYQPDGVPFLITTTLRLPTGTVDLWVVHTTAPVNPGWNYWNIEMAQVDGLLRQLHPRPLLMVGDFNSTWGSRGFRAALSTGLTDAAPARGQPFDMTWSQLYSPIPPFVRIDHVLTSQGVVTTSIRTGDGPGSDHRDIQATVVFDPGSG